MSSGWILSRFRHSQAASIGFALFALWLVALSLGAQVGNPGTGAPVISSSISGQVINAISGLPVSRALVRFNDRAMLTDHDGKFEFDQNTEASGNIMVIKPGFFSTPDSLSSSNTYLQSNQLLAPLKLVLYPEALLTGTIVAPDDTPIPHVLVSAQKSVYDELGHRIMPVAQGQTDSHGNFRLPVSAGSYILETQYVAKEQTTGMALLPLIFPDKNSSNSLSEIQIRSGEEQHFDLRPRTSQIYNVIATTDSSSRRSIGSARITAHSSNGSALQVNPIFNSATGEIMMELPRGSYTLKAIRNSSELSEQAETAVVVPNHDIAGVTLSFSPIPSIPVEMSIDTGSTSDNSSPALSQFGLTLENDQSNFGIDNAPVRLSSVSNSQSFGFIAPPGSYHMRARGNGAWFIKSASAGDTDILQQGLIVAPGSAGTPIRLIVSNQTGSLQGLVKLNGTSGACWIYMIATTPSTQPVISMRSSSDGEYMSAHLAPGSYLVMAFEARHSINYADPAVLAPFASHIRSITINSGDKASLDLDAIADAELNP